MTKVFVKKKKKTKMSNSQNKFVMGTFYQTSLISACQTVSRPWGQRRSYLMCILTLRFFCIFISRVLKFLNFFNVSHRSTWDSKNLLCNVQQHTVIGLHFFLSGLSLFHLYLILWTQTWNPKVTRPYFIG